MSRCVFAAVALCLSSFAFGQNPTLMLAEPVGPNLLTNPSFELPPVTKRLSAKEGGKPTDEDETKSSWAHFRVFKEDKKGEGTLTVGLTNEFARTGKQSVYVDFDKVTGTNRRSYLMSRLVPIKPANTYRIAIWGRTDAKRPLTLDQRLAYMKVEIEYFTPDMEENAGDTDFRSLMIPGNSKRIFFASSKWTEYMNSVRTPRGAGWMKVTFRWETGHEVGATDGTIYFDDAVVTLVPGGESLIPVDGSDVIKTEPAEDAEAPEAGPAPAAPGTPAAPAKKP